MNMPNEEKLYSCPMHPEIRQNKPGQCPECGMNLLPVTETKKGKFGDRGSHCEKCHKSHETNDDKKHPKDKHVGHSTSMFLKKFWLSLMLTLPVVLFSEIGMKISGQTFLAEPLAGQVSLLFGSIVFFYGGWVFMRGAWHELRARAPGMMTLIAVAITTAYLYSTYAVLSVRGHALFWELTTLITIMLLGHWLEMRAVSGAQGALKELSKLLPDSAEIIETGGEIKIVPLLELGVGDVVLVRPGGRVPADGIVIEGESELNESMMTGESAPVAKKTDSEVIAGTINGDGALKVSISKVGEKTFLSGVMRLVAEAQASKSHLQILSDRAAFYLTIVALSAGVITFTSWLMVGAGMEVAVARLVAVLVIACPHALGLAVPLVASISTTLASRNGFLVKQRIALESARKIDTVLFDKTGTLTKGKFEVTNFSSDEALALAAAVETHSEHPIAFAIVIEAKKRGLAISEAKNFRRIPGIGAEALVAGKKVFVGQQGGEDIIVRTDEKIIGAISVADAVRPEAREALDELKNMGLKCFMITGDSKEVAEAVSRELGIDEYFARVRPEEKSEKIKELQGRGLKVAMVGDGINDGPALAQADLGIAVGVGTNVAIESAGIILVRNDPRDIAKIIRLSRLTYAKMIQNLWWAAGYNIIAMPLAAGVLASSGIILEPAVSAIFMSLSTIVVAINAALLKRVKI